MATMRFMLLGLFLVLGHSTTGQMPPYFPANCNTHSEPGEYHQVSCDHITSPEGVKLMRKALEDLDPHDGLPITIMLQMSVLDVLSPDVLESRNVTTLVLENCNMTKMPYALLCTETVRLVVLFNTLIPGRRLIPQGFKNCNKLESLSLTNNSLLLIPPGSFQGLDSLTELHIVSNAITLIPTFDGLGALKKLILGFNPIRFVPKNAFENMRKLTDLNLMNASITAVQEGAFDAMEPEAQVVLSGNPLNCDCALEWLQKWLKQHPVTSSQDFGIPSCATPMVGPLLTLDFCNQTSSGTKSSKGDDSTKVIPRNDSSSFQPGWILTIVCALTMISIAF